MVKIRLQSLTWPYLFWEVLDTPFWHYKCNKNRMSVLYINSDLNVVEYHQEYFFNDLGK